MVCIQLETAFYMVSDNIMLCFFFVLFCFVVLYCDGREVILCCVRLSHICFHGNYNLTLYIKYPSINLTSESLY